MSVSKTKKSYAKRVFVKFFGNVEARWEEVEILGKTNDEISYLVKFPDGVIEEVYRINIYKET